MAINFKMYLLFDLEIHILESDPAVILEVCMFAWFVVAYYVVKQPQISSEALGTQILLHT